MGSPATAIPRLGRGWARLRATKGLLAAPWGHLQGVRSATGSSTPAMAELLCTGREEGCAPRGAAGRAGRDPLAVLCRGERRRGTSAMEPPRQGERWSRHRGCSTNGIGEECMGKGTHLVTAVLHAYDLDLGRDEGLCDGREMFL
jgi:hypothetical protein